MTETLVNAFASKVPQDSQETFQRGFLKSIASDSNLIENEHPEYLLSLSAIVEALCQIKTEIIE